MMTFRARKINGKVTIGTCNGQGAVAAGNGRGGKGKRKLNNTKLGKYKGHIGCFHGKKVNPY